jgi:phosphinothricin acetyltransferase
MIRPATEKDLPEILSIYAPYVINTTYSFEYEVPDPDTFTQRFRIITRQFPWLVYEEEGTILGYAYASAPYERAAYRWCAEPSVYLREEARGQGIAAKLYTVLEAVLQEQGYVVLYALITSENTPSVRFHEKMGYHIRSEFPDCGFKHGRWCGLYWMEKRLKIVHSPSSFPHSSLSIVQDAERFANLLGSLSIS